MTERERADGEAGTFAGMGRREGRARERLLMKMAVP